jgi:hypothetical protein
VSTPVVSSQASSPPKVSVAVSSPKNTVPVSSPPKNPTTVPSPAVPNPLSESHEPSSATKSVVSITPPP